MVRLTNDIRSTIVNALMEHKFDGEVAGLCAERAAIAAAVYDTHYKRDLKRINDLPEGWLRTDDDISFEASGTKRQYQFSGKIYGNRWTERWGNDICDFKSNNVITLVYRRFRADDHGNTVAVYDANHPIAEAVEKHEARGEALAERIRTARKSAAATMGQFTTSEKLIEAWPEIAPFIPAQAAPKPSLPAVPVSHLNAPFDLPVEAEG